MNVLVTGGASPPPSVVASAELYDPATQTWALTGTMSAARSNHTATLLGNGKVVAVGAFGQSGIRLRSTELYDPASNTWTLTGSLVTGRVTQSTSLLTDGRVLIAGGQGDDSTVLSSAELYDPAFASWTATGPLATARNYHSSTLLNNGKVLAVGGSLANGIVIASTELYTPGIAAAPNCNPDIDGDGTFIATTDALILMRIGMGVNSSAAIGGINFPAAATRKTWPSIRDYLVTQCGFSLP